jgi:hypothetical protein
VQFSSFATLNGGNGTNIFKIDTNVNSAVDSIVGGSGSNTLDFSSLQSGASVSLDSASATAVSHFSNIQNLVGSPHSTLHGYQHVINGNTWSITGRDAGSVGGISFSAFPNLVGGSFYGDSFQFKGGNISGSIDGTGGIKEKLDFSSLASDVWVDLGAKTASLIGSFAGITNLVANDSSPLALSTLSAAAGPSTPSAYHSPLATSSGAQPAYRVPSNTLYGPSSDNTWQIKGSNWGVVGGTSGVVGSGVLFSGFQNLVGAHSSDRFVFSDGAGVTGSIRGNPFMFNGHVISGTSNVTLDYSAYKTDVYVNLKTHQATGVGGGVQYINNVTVAHGNNILVGDGTGNTLRAGGGRDLLISGGGNARLYGDAGEAILISGHTSWDTDLQTLKKIETLWADPLTDYWSRTAAIAQYLNYSTVFDDGTCATLTSGSGRDWFWSSVGDTLMYARSDERIGLSAYHSQTGSGGTGGGVPHGGSGHGGHLIME